MIGQNPTVLEIESSRDARLAVELRIEFQGVMGVALDPASERRLREVARAHFEHGFADDSVAMLLARVDGGLAGCAMLQEQRMIPNHRVPAGRTGMVLNVLVRDGFRRIGIGMALMRGIEAEGRSRGLDRLDLKATEMGEPLYRKLGWIDASGGRPMELDLSVPVGSI